MLCRALGFYVAKFIPSMRTMLWLYLGGLLIFSGSYWFIISGVGRQFLASAFSNDTTVNLTQNQLDPNANRPRVVKQSVDSARGLRLASRLRILCWVLTTVENHVSKARHVKSTWGHHCDSLLFVSDYPDPELPAISPDNVRLGRDGLWSKTVGAFQYIHHHFRDDYDWVVKADDDSFVFVENIRAMTLPYSSEQPHFFGLRFIPLSPVGYMSGGAGYVLSRDAVRRVVEHGFHPSNKDCPPACNGAAEDVNIGKLFILFLSLLCVELCFAALCLNSVGVKPSDSRDYRGLNRFFPFIVYQHTNPDQSNKDWWYWKNIWFLVKGGYECCSDEATSFHYVTPIEFYITQYLAYTVSPFSLTHVSKAPINTDVDRSKMSTNSEKLS